jgi:hypothetical protein
MLSIGETREHMDNMTRGYHTFYWEYCFRIKGNVNIYTRCEVERDWVKQAAMANLKIIFAIS